METGYQAGCCPAILNSDQYLSWVTSAVLLTHLRSPQCRVGSTPDSGHGSDRREHLRCVPQAALSKRSETTLFDHLVGARQDGRRNVEANRPRNLEIDHQFEPCWLLDWKITRVCTAQDLVNV